MTYDVRALFGRRAKLVRKGWSRDGPDWVLDGANGPDRRVPLYEAKMIHHFDHRWATYPEGDASDDAARDVTLAEKRDPAFEPQPRYWVPEDEVTLRAARVPSRLKSAWRRRDKDPDACARVLGEWLAGAFPDLAGRPLAEDDLGAIFGHDLDWSRIALKPFALWLAAANGGDMQKETPLTRDDLDFLREGSSDPLDLAWAIMERKQPRWLMGWRDICRSTDERTVIASVFPKVGSATRFPVVSARSTSSSSVLRTDGSCVRLRGRQKIGGTHLSTSIETAPVIPPSAFTEADLDFITPRVLELTYTSHAMRPWAEDLGHRGPPLLLVGTEEPPRAASRPSSTPSSP